MDWAFKAKTVYGPKLWSIQHSNLDCPVRKLAYCPQSHVLFVNYQITNLVYNEI